MYNSMSSSQFLALIYLYLLSEFTRMLIKNEYNSEIFLAKIMSQDSVEKHCWIRLPQTWIRI